VTESDGVDGARSRHRCAIVRSSETNHMRGAVLVDAKTFQANRAHQVSPNADGRPLLANARDLVLP
jgi:hypothetical protein